MDNNEMDELQLKRCPFCGNDASFGLIRIALRSPITSADGTPKTEGHFVNCMACQANNNGIVHGYDNKEEAAAAWNKRV